MFKPCGNNPNPGEYQALKKAAKVKFFELVDDIQKANKGKNAEKMMKDITSEVEKARSKKK